MLSALRRLLYSVMKTLMQVDAVQDLSLLEGDRVTQDLEYAGVH
jgi:hypothetical protein